MSKSLVLLGFLLVLGTFLCVGLSARRRVRATTDDYLTAGRDTHPWLVGWPLVVIQALRQPYKDAIGTAMILGGFLTVLFWRYGLQYSSSIYEVLPGMLAGFAIYGGARLLGFPSQAADPAAAGGMIAEGSEA